jgi:EAL domain-containing protein (putative c-di-GMP-specific phosphodiesterase class I)
MSMDVLQRISEEGIVISIDDFGTGHSSLSLLKKLPVKELKIDKSFVLNMQDDPEDRKIAKAVIDLAHNFGMRVVAEGIETKQALNLLTEMGCDQGQGYYMAKPMPEKDIKKWLIESSWVNDTEKELG